MFKRNIAHLTSVHPAFDNRVFFKECRSLVQAGYNLALVAPHKHDEIVEGIRIHAIPKPRNRLKRMVGASAHVFRKAVELKADLYHFHDPELLPVGLILKARGKRVIYDIHEDLPRAIFAGSRINHQIKKTWKNLRSPPNFSYSGLIILFSVNNSIC